MSKRNEQEDLIFKAQGLTEAIELLSQYEEILQGLVDKPSDKALADKFDSLSQRTSDIQKRFEPHLSQLGSFAAQMNALGARMEEDEVTPSGGEHSAVSNSLANLQSDLRKTHSDIELFDKWVDAKTDDLLIEIAVLSECLLNVQRIFEFSNSVRSNAAQSEVFRETVVKLLSSAVEELKAPAVNVSRLKGIGSTLRKVLKKSAEKKLGEAADTALDEAVRQTGRVVDMAKDLPGIDGLL